MEISRIYRSLNTELSIIINNNNMHIAYSALHQVPPANQSTLLICDENSEIPEPLLRYRAYQAACQKLSHEIAAIQKYIPGWMPAFR